MATGKADPKKLEAMRKQLETMRKTVKQQAQAAKPLASMVVTPGKLPPADGINDDDLPDLTSGME